MIVLLITFICCFQDRLSSIVTSNNFSDVICSSLFSLRNTFRILSLSFIKIRFWRVPDNITFVLSTFVTIWFERHHDWILFEQICKSFSIIFTFLFDTKYVESSAKRDNCLNPSSRLKGKSLIKIKNNRGPSIEPCSQEEISQRVEWWYKVFLIIDLGSYGSGVIISRGCVQFYPVAFLKSDMADKTPWYQYSHHNF